MRIITPMGLEQPIPPVSTPFLLHPEKKREVNTKSCFNFAENCEASSLWVDAHRYTRISCASKLLWVWSDLKLVKNLVRFLNP